MGNIKAMLNTFLEIFLPKNYNEFTQETELDSRITEVMSKGPIDNTISKDDFIRLIVRIYGNDKKYKPFDSKINKSLRIVIKILILISIGIAIYGCSIRYFHNLSIIEGGIIRKHYHQIWIYFANFIYVLIIPYILVILYENIRKIIRHEIKKKRFIKNVLKPFWLVIIVPFTWFIGAMFGTIIVFTIDLLTNLFK